MTDMHREGFDFSIDDTEPRVIRWKSGGCRPATTEECELWDARNAALSYRDEQEKAK